MRISYFPSDYVIYDFETTSKYSDQARVVEIAAIKVRNGKLTNEVFETLCNPGVPIPQEASEVNHITDDMLVGKPSDIEAMQGFFDFVGDMPVSGWNIKSYDQDICRRYAWQMYQGHFHNRAYDGIWFARDYFSKDPEYMAKYPNPNKPSLPDCRLVTLQDYFGITNQAQHRALGDILACYEVNQCLDKLYIENVLKQKTTLKKMLEDVKYHAEDIKCLWLNGIVFASNSVKDLVTLLPNNADCIQYSEGKLVYALDLKTKDILAVVNIYNPYEIEMLLNVYSDLNTGLVMDFTNIGLDTSYAVQSDDLKLTEPVNVIKIKDAWLKKGATIANVMQSAYAGEAGKTKDYIIVHIPSAEVFNTSKTKKEHKDFINDFVNQGYLTDGPFTLKSRGKMVVAYDQNGDVALVIKSYKRGEYALLKRINEETELAVLKDMIGGLQKIEQQL